MDIKKISKYAWYILVLVMVLVAFSMIYSPENEAKGSNFGIWLGVILSVVTTGLALILSGVSVIQSPKSLIWFGGGALALVILYFIGKSMAPDSITQKMIDAGESVSSVQMSHAGVWVAIALIGLSVLLAIASGVRSIFAN